jgi:hypothetical protein
MHPHFKPLGKEKLDEISDRKKKHQECLIKLRMAYEEENKQLEAIDETLEEQAETVKTLPVDDQLDKEEDLQDSLEEDSDQD